METIALVPGGLIAAVIYSILGLVVFGVGLYIFEKLTPGNMWHEIIEEHNTSLSVMLAGFAIALSIIISAAIQG